MMTDLMALVLHALSASVGDRAVPALLHAR